MATTLLLSGRACSGFYRRVGGLSPLDPGTVVHAYFRIVEDVLEREPGATRPVADRAVGDHLLVRRNSCLFEHAAQLVGRLQRLVGVAQKSDGNADRPRDVPRSPDVIGCARRPEALAG